MDTKQAMKYFSGGQFGHWGTLLLGIVTLPIFVGIALIAYWLFQNKDAFGAPSDEDFDAAVKAKAGDIKSRALKKFGVDESELTLIEPIVFFGPSLDAPAGKQSLVKRGKDGIWRTSAYNAVAVFFSESQLFIYQHTWSMVNSNRSENADEYFYKDIVSVSTQSDSETFEEFVKGTKTERQVNIEAFSLRTTGGNAAKAGIERRFAPNIDRQVQGMKNLIREKKAAS